MLGDRGLTPWLTAPYTETRILRPKEALTRPKRRVLRFICRQMDDGSGWLANFPPINDGWLWLIEQDTDLCDWPSWPLVWLNEKRTNGWPSVWLDKVPTSGWALVWSDNTNHRLTVGLIDQVGHRFNAITNGCPLFWLDNIPITMGDRWLHRTIYKPIGDRLFQWTIYQPMLVVGLIG